MMKVEKTIYELVKNHYRDLVAFRPSAGEVPDTTLYLQASARLFALVEIAKVQDSGLSDVAIAKIDEIEQKALEIVREEVSCKEEGN